VALAFCLLPLVFPASLHQSKYPLRAHSPPTVNLRLWHPALAHLQDNEAYAQMNSDSHRVHPTQSHRHPPRCTCFLFLPTVPRSITITTDAHLHRRYSNGALSHLLYPLRPHSPITAQPPPDYPAQSRLNIGTVGSHRSGLCRLHPSVRRRLPCRGASIHLGVVALPAC
jgi:hypothetical protein